MRSVPETGIQRPNMYFLLYVTMNLSEALVPMHSWDELLDDGLLSSVSPEPSLGLAQSGAE